MSTDLLSQIQAACVDTEAEGLTPTMAPPLLPQCTRNCPLWRQTHCQVLVGVYPEWPECRPAVYALARLVMQRAAE
jgi:hypothetical protein